MYKLFMPCPDLIKLREGGRNNPGKFTAALAKRCNLIKADA